jgi:hypothetical protein
LASFTPLYFAIVGLKLDLIHQLDLELFLFLFLFTTSFQTAATLAASRLIRKDWLTSVNSCGGDEHAGRPWNRPGHDRLRPRHHQRRVFRHSDLDCHIDLSDRRELVPIGSVERLRGASPKEYSTTRPTTGFLSFAE